MGIFKIATKTAKSIFDSNKAERYEPANIESFGDLNYREDMSKTGTPDYTLSGTNGIFNRAGVAIKKAPKTDVEKALTSIAYAQQDLRNAGVDVPKPDTANAPKRNILEKIIFDPISSLQYGIAGGVKNLVDDNEDTTFLQGLGRGIAGGFFDKYADDRTSWRDVLQTMMDNPQKTFNRNFLQGPNSDFVQAMKNNPNLHKPYIDALEKNVKSGKAGEYDKILLDYLKGNIDLEEAQQRWRQWFDPNKSLSVGWTMGLAGDMFLDPMNLINGWIKSARVILGGTKIISGSKAIGGLDEAVDVVKALDLAADSADVVKTARDLLAKTTKKLGYLDDFEGLTIGIGDLKKTIVSAEKLAQFGDWSRLSKLGDILSAPGKAIGNTKIVNQLRNAFGGGKYGDFLRAAKANPEEALKNIGYVDFLKKSKGKHKKAVESMNSIYQELKKKIHDVDPQWDSLITKMREETDDVVVENIKKMLVDNPEYLSEIKKIQSTTKAGITRYENLIKKYSDQIELLKEAGATKQAAEALSEYTKLSKQLDEIKEIYGSLSKYYTGSSEIPFEDFVTKKHLQGSNFAKEIGDTSKKALQPIIGEPPTYEEFMKREGKLLKREYDRTKTGFSYNHNEYMEFTRSKYKEHIKRYVPLSKSDAKLQEQIRNAAKVLGLELDDDYFKNTPIAKQREYQKQLAKEVTEYKKYTRMLQGAKKSGAPATEAQIKYIEDILNRGVTRDYLKKKGYKLHNMTPAEIAELKSEVISQRLAKYKQQGGKAKAMEDLYNYKKNITAKNKENLMRQAVNRPIQELSTDLPDDLSDIVIESKQVMKGGSKTQHMSARAVEPSTLERIESLYSTLKKHGLDKDIDTGIIDAIKDPNSHISVSQARKELGGLISEYNRYKPYIQAKDLIETATKKGFATGVSEDVLKQLNEGTLPREQAEELVKSLTQLRSKTKNFSLKKVTDKQMNWYQTMLNRLNSKEIAEWNAKYPWSKIKQNDDPALFYKAADELQNKLVKSGRWEILNKETSNFASKINHVPGSKKPYQITIGNYTYGSSVDKIGRHHFDTPLGKIVIDDKVKPENVAKFLDELQSLPDEVKAAMKNSTTEITDTKLIQEVAGVRKEIIGQNIGRDNIRIYVTDKAPPRSLMEHELAHNIPSHKVNNLQRTMFNEGQKLTDEAVAEVREALRESGLVSMRIDDDFDEFLKRGYISRYPVSLLDYAGDIPTQKSLKLAAKENTAELAVLLFHDNPNVSKVIQKHFPESSKALYEEFITLGSKDLLTDRAKSIVPTVQERLDRLQEIIDTLTPDELKKARSVRDFQKKLGDFNQKLAEYKRKQDLIDAGEIAKLVDSSVPPTVEKEIIEKATVRVPKIESDPNVPKEILEVQEELTNWMRHFAEEEELGEEFIELVHEYVPHIINRSKLKQTKKGREYLKSIELLNEAPLNVHSLNRKYKGTIEKLNRSVFEKYGIDNAFETEISRIFFQRGLDHEKFMYDKNNFETLINFFGEESVDLSKIKKLPDESDKAFIKRVSEQLGIEPNYKIPDPVADMKRRYAAIQKQKLSSGKYVMVRPVPEWIRGDQLKIDHEAFIEYLKTGKTGNKKINELIQELGDDSTITQMLEAIQKAELKSPFIRVDTNMMDFEKVLMKNPDSKLYMMPRQTYEAYNKMIADQFKQNKNAFLKVYDYITSLFKTNATVLNLPFHVTNKVGNTYRMYIEYGSKVFDPKYTQRAIQTLRGTGKFYGRTGAEWLEIAKIYGVIGDDIFTDIPTSLSKLDAMNIPKTPLRKLSEAINPLDLKWKPYEVGRKLSSYIEDTDRLITFFIGIENGMSVQGAADVVNKLLFDYSDVTKFESQVMKRIFPFYTWLRKNIPLQLELLAEHPQRYARLNRIMKAFNEEETEIQKLYKPKYIQGDSIHLGDGKYLALNLPIGDMERIFEPREVLSSMNPILKLAMELPTNTNIYFDSPIQVRPGAMTKAPAWARLIPDISDSINIVKDTPKGRMVDPKLKYALETIFSPLKHASDIYSYATGEGTDYSNQRAINALSGIRRYNVDTDAAQLQALYDYLEKLKNELQNAKYQGYAR